MKTQKFLLLLCLFIGITAIQLVAQVTVVKTPVQEIGDNFPYLPLYCGTSSERVDVLDFNSPYYLWSVIRYDADGNMITFFSYWTDVVLTARESGEVFRVVAGSERFEAGEVYDIKIRAIGSEGTRIVLHLSGYGNWHMDPDGWEVTVAKCF